MTKVAVAILNWNGIKHLQTYLSDLVNYSFGQANIYLIDNGSTDDSVSWVKQHFSTVSVLPLPYNLGFCEGYNQGLSNIQEPYTILLNSDVRVSQGWLTPLIDWMDAHPDVAACQPKILDVSNPHFFEYAGASGGFIDRYGFPFCRGRIFQTLEPDSHQYDQPIEIHWASGAALMIRTALYHSMGGFDSRLFAHMEEIDLCWRLRSAGYRIYCCPQSVVYHLGGGTLSMDHPHKTFLNVRNNLLMLNKNTPQSLKWKVIPVKLLLDGIAGIYFLLQGKWKNTLAIIRGHWAFYLSKKAHPDHLPELQGKQQAYQALYPRSIVWQYYIKGKKRYSDLFS